MFCKNCGNEIGDAKFCAACGTESVEHPQTSSTYQQSTHTYQQSAVYPRAGSEGLYTAAFVFMIIGIVSMAAITYGIALAWCIPMTVYTYRIKNGIRPNSSGFGVCCLIFVSIIAGILLLVAPKDQL